MPKYSFFCRLSLLGILLTMLGCAMKRAQTYDFPEPVDTSSRPIVLQEKKIYSFSELGVYADNRFAGARLNGMIALNDTLLQATVAPENTPINHSAFYAFRIWADSARALTVELDYVDQFHRYWPKLSHDGFYWRPMDSSRFEMAADSSWARLQLTVGPDTLYVSGQELLTSDDVWTWCSLQAIHPAVQLTSAGKSAEGRELPRLEINEGDPIGKDLVVVLSRQHPPEVTGYLAMQAFVHELLADNELSNAFRKRYRVLVYPILNPDGVDLGHWRHNTGGVDLNRDWAYYRQPEIRQVANDIVHFRRKGRNRVVLGLDFHSTWHDMFYTPDETAPSVIDGFKEKWLAGIEASLKDYAIREEPGPVKQPTSSGWFITQFDAEGITFEIGDDTPRTLVRRKGQVGAIEMMKALMGVER